jgi:transcriptional regulator with XRE-family HTH domain
LSNRAGVSKGLLSKIENGRTIPSLPVLLEIIRSLETELTTFFDGLNNPSYVYIHQKSEEYIPYQKEDAVGFNYFSILTQSFGGIIFQAVLLKLEPRSYREKVTTDGYEFIYLIDGEIDYILDKHQLTMKKGDSLFFDGRIPHVKLNNSEKTAEILVIYMLTSKN